jgi:hypothetical protein
MKRRDAVDFANASVRLEGLEPSPEALRRGEQFVAGDIEARELVRNTEGMVFDLERVQFERQKMSTE